VSSAPPPDIAGGWAFLEYMLQPANAKAWHLQGGYLPIVKSVSDEPDVRAYWSDTVPGVLVKTAVDQLDDADPDEPGPLIGPYPDFTDEVENAVEGVLLSDVDIATALGDSQDKVTESLERYAG
jgi:sn-glycerol 3-phosphate transport system substrate-binding protein